jgi:flagellar hook-length control protein FliK
VTTDAILIANAEPQNRAQPNVNVQPQRNARYENAKRDSSFADALDKSASTAKADTAKTPKTDTATTKTETPKAKTENDLSEKLDSATEKQDYTAESKAAPEVTTDSDSTDIPDMPVINVITATDDPVIELTDELITVIAAPLMFNFLITPEQLPEEFELSDLQVMTEDGTLEPALEHPEIGQLSLLDPEKYAGLNPEIPLESNFKAVMEQVDSTVENVRTVQPEQTVAVSKAEIAEPDIIEAPDIIVSDNVPIVANPDIVTAQTTMVANAEIDSAKLTDEGTVKPDRDIFVPADKSKPLISTESGGEDSLEPITAIEEVAPVTPRESASGNNQNNENSESDKPKDSDNTAVKDPQNGQTIDLAPRQVFAQAQTEAAKPVQVIQDVRPNEIFNKIVESAQLVKDVDGSSITMQLKPEHLGKVALQVALNGEGTLNLKITADDPNVRGMLNTQLAKLVETLSEKGLKIASADVVYTGVADDNYGEASRQRQNENTQNRRGGRRYTRESAIATIDTNAALIGYQPYFGNDTEVMEYVA